MQHCVCLLSRAQTNSPTHCTQLNTRTHKHTYAHAHVHAPRPLPPLTHAPIQPMRTQTRVDKVAPGECAVIFDEFTPVMLEWGFDWVSHVSGQVEVRDPAWVACLLGARYFKRFRP